MFKLLTDKEKQKVSHEYALRRIIVILFGLIMVFLIGIVGLLPSYVLSSNRRSEVLERSRVISSVTDKEDKTNLQTWLSEINRKLDLLSPKRDVDRPSYLILKILNQSFSGVHIKEISWVKVQEKINLQVNGVALDRQTLLTFERHLNDSGYFSEVVLPISNLAKDKNIDFQVKVTPL